MTTKLGAVTFPLDPSSIRNQEARELKAIKVKVKLPLIFSMGPEVPIIKMKGILAEQDRDAEYAYTNWIKPLRDMYRRPMALPTLLGDDDMVAEGNWQVYTWGTGSYGINISDDTSVVKKGNNSLRMDIIAGTNSNVGVIRTYSPAQDFSKQDFVVIWWYGANSGDTCQIRFITSSGNYYQKQWTDNFSGWQRLLYRKDEFSVIGSPSWDSIVDIVIETIPSSTHVNYLDRTVVGVGYFLDAPGTRYDGIYNMKKMLIDESYKAIAAFPYEIELWWVDDYY